MLQADTVAVTVAPHGRLNGDAIKLEIGIEQVLKETTAGKVPLQSVVIVEQVSPSLLRILISYSVIDEPPLSGKSHNTTTLSELIVVVGGLGQAGF